METLFLKSEMGKRMVSQMLDQPDAYLIMQAVTDALNQERERRIRFYNDITEQEKVEFINGEIVVHSPVKKMHNEATGLLYRLLSIYVGRKKLGFVGFEKIMITLSRNDYEPDICFYKKEKSADLRSDQTLFPVPDFVVEVLSPSTEMRDRGIKFKDYQAHQVEEYWIINVDTKMVEQYHLKDEEYELILKAGNGNIQSFAVEGFEIPIEAIFDEEVNLGTISRL